MKKIDQGKDRRCVFIGGKQIGADCLKQLLNHNIIPLLVIPNLDDDGSYSWHESLVKVARLHSLEIPERRKLNDPELINQINNLNPEIIFCIGSTQIVPKEIIKIPKLGCLNIHPALLPKYRGRYSTVHALFNGEKKTGTTVHWMDEGIDSGPIIKQREIVITDSDTAKTLYDKFTRLGEKMFREFLTLWLSGKNIPSIPQNEKKATYFAKSLPNNGMIDWRWNGKKIYNFIRAMTFEPFPPASFKIGNKKMVIVDETNGSKN